MMPLIVKEKWVEDCRADTIGNAIIKVDGSCNQQINAITSLKNTSIDFLYYLIEEEVHVLLNAAGQSGMAILNKNDFSNRAKGRVAQKMQQATRVRAWKTLAQDKY